MRRFMCIAMVAIILIASQGMVRANDIPKFDISGGVGAGIFHFYISETDSAHIKVIGSSEKTELLDKWKRDSVAYLGWAGDFNKIRLSVGVLMTAKQFTEKTPPYKVVGGGQQVSPRGEVASVWGPVVAFVGLSKLGIDHFAGVEIPIFPAVNLMAGHFSWPRSHGGFVLGLNAHW